MSTKSLFKERFPEKIRHVIILKTTTPEKTAQYEAIARHYNLPIHFMDMTDIADGFVVAVEDTADRVKNAQQKMEDPENIKHHLRDSKSKTRQILDDRLTTLGMKPKKIEYHLRSCIN